MRAGLYTVAENKQWRMLFVYNVYRIVSIGFLMLFYFFSLKTYVESNLFLLLLVPYSIFACLCFFLAYNRYFKFERLVVFSGVVDVISISTMLIIIGDLYVGYGILLNIIIAYLSILLPGRIAIFFAALASCFLLYGILMSFLGGDRRDLNVFFYSGVYGAGFFATALTAWYLANRVRISENLALARSDQLANMQKINEYIVERLHSGIIYIDDEQQIKLINTAARKFFNLKKGQTPKTLKQISNSLTDKLEKFMAKTKPNEGVAQAFLQDPYLRIHFVSTQVAQSSEVLIILDDMTFVSQQAQQLKLASLGRLSASIAHELRNPLGAISHAIQLLGDTNELMQEDVRLKQLIKNNCDRMNGVIKNVLQLTRRRQSQPQVIDIDLFLMKFRDEFLHNNQSGCTINIRPPKKNSHLIVFDESQLEQILVILCDNAITHGRIDDRKVKILIAVKIAANKTTLVVSDSGAGIPIEHKEMIFEPFFTTQSSGTGMGLFIARDLCEINQAQLNLMKSRTGSCFAITINPSNVLL